MNGLEVRKRKEAKGKEAKSQKQTTNNQQNKYIMLIKSTNLKNAHLMDFSEVMSLVASFLEKEDLDALKLTNVSKEFNDALHALEGALTQARKTGITDSLLEADKLRDDVFTGLNLTLRGMTHFPDHAIADTAAAITIVVEKYGKGIKKLPQREETAVLTNLIQDLKSDDHKTQVETVSLTAWVEELEKANNTFEQLYTERTEKEVPMHFLKAKRLTNHWQRKSIPKWIMYTKPLKQGKTIQLAISNYE